jgi:cystathionine gamma-synthase
MTRSTRETFAVQAGGEVHGDEGAIVPDIQITTTFERAGDLSYPAGAIYGRSDNRTVAACEAVITELEHGGRTLLLGSGMAAATAFFLALPRPAHVIAPTVMYWALRDWLQKDAKSFGIEATFVDATDTDAIAAAIRPGQTRAIWLETPANPLWGISDIRAAAELAGAGDDCVLAVDSTAATPVLSQPLTLGADVVMHSATKYLNGHSDVLAGSLTFKDGESELATAAARVRNSLGAVLGPFEGALLLRGMRTLFVRVARQSATAAQIAAHFASDKRVAAVLYPGLEAHPGHALAASQMTGGFGGMLSIQCAGGRDHAVATAARLVTIKRATSLGGIESLVEHRASIEGAGSPCPDDLLRFSIGLEAPEDLISDIDQALNGPL